MAIARRAVDRHTLVHQRLAKCVNILNLDGNVTEITAAIIDFRIPVVGQFQQGSLVFLGSFLVFRGSQKNQRKSTAFAFDPVGFDQTEFVAIKFE